MVLWFLWATDLDFGVQGPLDEFGPHIEEILIQLLQKRVFSQWLSQSPISQTLLNRTRKNEFWTKIVC